MSATIERFPSETVADFEGVFGAVSDAHWSSGFDAGYRRAANELMAELALCVAEVGRERPEARDGLRALQRRLEQQADVQPRSDATAGYVDGGLGI